MSDCHFIERARGKCHFIERARGECHFIERAWGKCHFIERARGKLSMTLVVNLFPHKNVGSVQRMRKCILTHWRPSYMCSLPNCSRIQASRLVFDFVFD